MRNYRFKRSKHYRKDAGDLPFGMSLQIQGRILDSQSMIDQAVNQKNKKPEITA